MTRRWLPVAVASAARRMSRDRAALTVAFGFYAVVATVISTLWRTAANAHGGSIGGYSGAQLTWYLYFSEAAVTALNPRQIELTGDDIASGAVAVDLLRPASVLGVRVATELGRSLPRLAGCTAIGVALAVLTGGPVPAAAGLLLALPSLVLAVACNLVAQHAFAGAAFWIRDARSTWFLYQKLVFLLGAMLLPLQLLPGWLHTLAAWLPFVAMAYAPARLASGHVEAQLLALQGFWFLVLVTAAVAVFSAGERRLQVVGG
ncbi:MAG TPA: ABC-2 family transporter protein [Candidatus Dormibacteraeota bacterium]|nr:ABC-2 family transporter protein [Candidatus Dormibacteraeota bacterium]